MTTAVDTIDAAELEKTNLLGLTRQQLSDFLAGLGEKPFRAQQLMKWMHHAGVDDFDQMTNISKALRAKLKEVARITPPPVVKQLQSTDGTRKWLIDVGGGNHV